MIPGMPDLNRSGIIGQKQSPLQKRRAAAATRAAAARWAAEEKEASQQDQSSPILQDETSWWSASVNEVNAIETLIEKKLSKAIQIASAAPETRTPERPPEPQERFQWTASSPEVNGDSGLAGQSTSTRSAAAVTSAALTAGLSPGAAAVESAPVVAALQKSVANLSVQEERLRCRAQGAEGEIADLRRALVSFKEELQDQTQQRQWEQMRDQRREQLTEQLRQQVNTEVLDAVRQELEDVRGRCASLSATMEEQGGLVTLCAAANARSMECCQELRESISLLSIPGTSSSMMNEGLQAISGEHQAGLSDLQGSLREELAALREQLRARHASLAAELRVELAGLGAELRREIRAEAEQREMLKNAVDSQNSSVVQLEALMSKTVSTLREEIAEVQRDAVDLRRCFSDKANDTTERDLHEARWAVTSDKLAQLEAQTQAIEPALREAHSTALSGLASELEEKHSAHRDEHAKIIDALEAELRQNHERHRAEHSKLIEDLAKNHEAHREEQSKALEELAFEMQESFKASKSESAPDDVNSQVRDLFDDFSAEMKQELKQAHKQHIDQHRQAHEAYREDLSSKLKEELLAHVAENTALTPVASSRGLEEPGTTVSMVELVATVKQMQDDLGRLLAAPGTVELVATVREMQDELVRLAELQQSTIANVPDTLQVLRNEVDMVRNLHEEKLQPMKLRQEQQQEQLTMLPKMLEAIKLEVHQLHSSHMEKVACALGEEFDKVQQELLREHTSELDALKTEVTELRSNSQTEPRSSSLQGQDLEEHHVDIFRDALREEHDKQMEQIVQFVDNEFAKRNLASERMDELRNNFSNIAKGVEGMAEDEQTSLSIIKSTSGEVQTRGLSMPEAAALDGEDGQLAGITTLAESLRLELGGLRDELAGSQTTVVASASAALAGRWRILQEQLLKLSKMARLQQDMHSQHLASIENLHLKHAVLAKSVLGEDPGSAEVILPQQTLLTACEEVLRAMEQSVPLSTPRLAVQDALSLPRECGDGVLVRKDGTSITVADELQMMRQSLEDVRAQVNLGCWEELRVRHLELSQQVATLQDMHSHYTQKLYVDLRAVIQEITTVGLASWQQGTDPAMTKAMDLAQELDTPRREQIFGLSEEVIRLREAVQELREGASRTASAPGSGAMPSFREVAEAGALGSFDEVTRLREAVNELREGASQIGSGAESGEMAIPREDGFQNIGFSVDQKIGTERSDVSPSSPFDEAIRLKDPVAGEWAERDILAEPGVGIGQEVEEGELFDPTSSDQQSGASAFGQSSILASRSTATGLYVTGLTTVTEKVSPESAPAVSSAGSFQPRQLFEDDKWNVLGSGVTGSMESISLGTVEPRSRREATGIANLEGGLWNAMSREESEETARPPIVEDDTSSQITAGHSQLSQDQAGNPAARSWWNMQVTMRST